MNQLTDMVFDNTIQVLTCLSQRVMCKQRLSNAVLWLSMWNMNYSSDNFGFGIKTGFVALL